MNGVEASEWVRHHWSSVGEPKCIQTILFSPLLLRISCTNPSCFVRVSFFYAN